MGFLVAGHDTTSTTISWGLKLLADNLSAQRKLRAALRSALDEANVGKRQPAADEITKTTVPYLDACIEEILRMGKTSPGPVRTAQVDTAILGHHIPKGTTVFFMNTPDVGFVEEEKRSETSRAAKDRLHTAKVLDPGNFRPERWLCNSDEGQETFDSTAVPGMPFGGGPRGCYGKRLAYLELRMVLALVIWNFELQQCPSGLSSYASIDGLSHRPRSCYVRLKEVS